jgi:hypothetical protein
MLYAFWWSLRLDTGQGASHCVSVTAVRQARATSFGTAELYQAEHQAGQL